VLRAKPFTGLAGFVASYREARRALRHTRRRRPVVVAPHDIGLFDELVAGGHVLAATGDDRCAAHCANACRPVPSETVGTGP
jgi:hypothetical protein